MSDIAINDLFQCQEGVHAIHPEDLLDPAGSECRCGAITLIGVVAGVKGSQKLFVAYLIDTNTPDESED